MDVDVSALAFLLCACVSLEPAYVVIDGDMFDLAGERIRIANIDAPGISSAKCDKEFDLGQKAKRRLEELLMSGFVTLIRGDPVDGRNKDDHGHTLGTISIEGQDIGEVMIKEGLAHRRTGRREQWCD